MIHATSRRTIAVTCVVESLEHRVADEVAAAKRDDIRLRAVCGDDVFPGPGNTPPGRPCPKCDAVLSAAPPPRQPIDVADLLERAKGDPRVGEAAARIPLQRDRAAHRRRGRSERSRRRAA